MTTFNVPTRDEVSENNQAIFDNLEKGVGFVPNLYASFAHSENALGTYLGLSQAKSSLTNKEKEAINLVVSQVNECRYCQSAHTAIGKMNGFTDEEILDLRAGESGDTKLDALVKLAKNFVETKGHPAREKVENFLNAGFATENLVDLILVIGDKTITNYLHGVLDIPIDFPLAPELQTSEVA